MKRNFQASWFKERSWLHYEETNNFAFCHVCVVAYRDGKLCRANPDKAYILNGFSNRKDSSASVRKHKPSKWYTESVQKVITLPKITKYVGETLSKKYAED